MEQHKAECANCFRLFERAMSLSVLLKERQKIDVTPPPDLADRVGRVLSEVAKQQYQREQLVTAAMLEAAKQYQIDQPVTAAQDALPITNPGQSESHDVRSSRSSVFRRRRLAESAGTSRSREEARPTESGTPAVEAQPPAGAVSAVGGTVAFPAAIPITAWWMRVGAVAASVAGLVAIPVALAVSGLVAIPVALAVFGYPPNPDLGAKLVAQDQKIAVLRKALEEAGSLSTELAARDLETAVLQRALEETLLLDVNYPGRETLVRANLAVQRHQQKLVQQVAARRSRSPANGALAYDEAIVWSAVQAREKNRQPRPTLVINGADPSRVREYTYAQAAVDQLSDLLQSGDEIVLDSETRRQLVELARSQTGLAWPEPLLSQWTHPAGTPAASPVVIVVQVQPESGDRPGGMLSLVEWDPAQGVKRALSQVSYAGAATPIPLFDRFDQPVGQQGGVEVAVKSGNEAELRFRGDNQGLCAVSLNAKDNAPLLRQFAEVVFEAKADRGEPQVEFRTGGSNDSALIGIPPTRLGPEYRRFSIPIDLSEAEYWRTRSTCPRPSIGGQGSPSSSRLSPRTSPCES
jgi:hypothetical protein